MDIFFRTTTLILHILRFIYWTIEERKANREKPKTEVFSLRKLLKRSVALLVGIVMSLQLLGSDLFPFPNNQLIQTGGFLLVVIGISVTVAARKALGANWAHAAEYQIRKNHTLVTHGVYSYIRHPLYTGMFFATLGAEIVAGSYLFVPFALLASLYFAWQAKQEEKILLHQFGKTYSDYMKKSKMFLPGVF